jgi:hypothetical protein
MIERKKGTFSTDEHEDLTQGRSASITKDYLTLFTYKNDHGITPETVKKEALKELTAHCAIRFLVLSISNALGILYVITKHRADVRCGACCSSCSR